jgi:hypothetical protein
VTRSGLEDELSFLLGSLEDLEREKSAGDLSQTDYLVLRDRYTRRAAGVLRALERDEPPDSSASDDRDDGPDRTGGADGSTRDGAPPPARRRRGVLVVGLLIVVAAVAVTLVVAETGTRLPGQTETGSVSLSRAAQVRRTLAQAETLESTGNGADALRLYLQVLGQDPAQPDALAQSGWLEFQAGVQSRDAAVLSHAQSQELAAVRAAPGAYAPHLYLGSMLLAEGNATGAVGQYRQFLADGAPPAEVQVARSFIVQAFRQAGQPIPATLGTTTTSTTTNTARPPG